MRELALSDTSAVFLIPSFWCELDHATYCTQYSVPIHFSHALRAAAWSASRSALDLSAYTCLALAICRRSTLGSSTGHTGSNSSGVGSPFHSLNTLLVLLIRWGQPYPHQCVSDTQ